MYLVENVEGLQFLFSRRSLDWKLWWYNILCHVTSQNPGKEMVRFRYFVRRIHLVLYTRYGVYKWCIEGFPPVFFTRVQY